MESSTSHKVMVDEEISTSVEMPQSLQDHNYYYGNDEKELRIEEEFSKSQSGEFQEMSRSKMEKSAHNGQVFDLIVGRRLIENEKIVQDMNFSLDGLLQALDNSYHEEMVMGTNFEVVFNEEEVKMDFEEPRVLCQPPNPKILQDAKTEELDRKKLEERSFRPENYSKDKAIDESSIKRMVNPSVRPFPSRHSRNPVK
ncbi:hypothetical protein HAX54_029850 [Datura stramonium]|uniref:Uncharacterized protein n=1 Tax=Datura stramonium TaxID=4076 RepID=A0ABS8V705_DATST|nr:hypothetical protein [Datura stramonium]